MQFDKTIKTKKLLLFTAVLVVGSCQVPDEPSQSAQQAVPQVKSTSEQLLAAQGTWNMVEEKAPANPVNQNLAARSQVDFHDHSSKRPYTKTASADALNEEVHFRVIKLEKEVSDLRSDFKKLLPPLANLIVSDRELDSTIEEIESDQANHRDIGDMQRHASNTHQTSDVVAKYAGSEQKHQKKAKAPVQRGGPNAVVAVRKGEHPGKTRLVLDVKQKPKVSYDLDNGEKVLVVELPHVGWDAKSSASYKNHPLIKSYSAQGAGGDGTTLVIELQKPVKVSMSSVLGPNSSNPNHRYVLDLEAQ